MYPPHQIRPQSRMNRTVPGQPGLTRKPLRPYPHIIMALATFLKPTMTAMTFAVVHHLQLPRRKGNFQSLLNLLRFRHFLYVPPSISAHKV